MALISDVTLENGISIKDAYLTVVNFSGTRNSLLFKINIYVNEQLYREGKPEVHSESHSIAFDPNRNIFSQAYEYLRTLPKYKNAKDV